MTDTESQNKTAILNKNGQQFLSEKEIIDEIIKIFSDNVIPINEVENIFKEVLDKIHKQPVKAISEEIRKIYSARNQGLIKC